MMNQIRLTGIYDLRTLANIKQLPVLNIGFDLRTRSFSFLQGYKLLEILEQSYDFNTSYFLNFENEKREVIEYIINDIEMKFGLNGSSKTPVNLNLEFSGIEEIEFCNSFKWNFLRHIDPDSDLEKLFLMNKLKGIILDYKLLRELNSRQNLYPFVNKINQQLMKLEERENFKIILSSSWKLDIDQAITSLLPFTFLSLPIDSYVETGYRLVDQQKLLKELPFYKLRGEL